MMNRPVRFSRLLPALMVVVIATSGCGDDSAAIRLDDEAAGDEAVDYRFVIPLGAGDALDRGTPLEILPARLDSKVGEVIEIVNEDERGHLIGPFFVGAHETLRQRFSAAGEFEGVCTVHPSGEIIVAVSE